MRLDTRPVASSDSRLAHKTARRALYDEARARTRVGGHGRGRGGLHSANLSISRDSNGENGSGSGSIPSSADADDAFDVLLWNEGGEVTECTLANVALRDAPEAGKKSRWRTPPLSSGLLPGTLRAELLRRGELYEGVVTVDEVRLADPRSLIAFNSLRGYYHLFVENSLFIKN